MSAFRWNQDFITGLPEVDKQHYSLVEIINEFGMLKKDNSLNYSIVDGIYKRLVDYASYHFYEEEMLMEESNIDIRHIVNHVNLHKSFLNDISIMYACISNDNINQTDNVLSFLIHWLAYHILGQDKNMAKQISAVQSGLSPVDAYEKFELERDSSTAPLLDALSGLLEQVAKQNSDLKQLNESLEEKVLLRTMELQEVNQHLEKLSYTDGLTGIPNRRYAMRVLSEIWGNSIENNYSLVCMMIDADSFKEINDIYGHDIGDRVLIELAFALRNALRNDDVVCRLGGDEFFIILPNTDIAWGLHVAESVRTSISKLVVNTGGEPWYGSISVGVASNRPDMKSYEELIKEADNSLYLAKSAGKNCVRTRDHS